MDKYISVSQYAQNTGKDPGNIRRMLIAGRLPGKKIGNQWVLKENAEYPMDSRIKSGQYRNQRRAVRFRSAHKELNTALNQMIPKLCRIYNEHLTRIVLYGSYARGTQTEDSDVDIALFLKKGHTESMHDQMTDIVVDFELELGVVLSVISLDEEQIEEWGAIIPFYKNVKKEGIVLWKNA